MAFLSPSNDTRVNLLLLIADLRSQAQGPAVNADPTAPPDAPLFLWEEIASRFGTEADKTAQKNNQTESPATPAPCSAAPPADDAFTLAVQADHGLKAEERNSLLEARKKVQSGCVTDAAGAIAGVEKVATTAQAKAYARYLEGAAEFWRTDFNKAAATFTSLTNAPSTWVRETATYMIGRSFINQALVGTFDEYGAFKANWHADAKAVAGAEAALDEYLQQYPKGVYAESARGLKRRGYWLADDTRKLEKEYGALLLLPPDERNISDVELVEEIDNKVASPPDSYGAPRDKALLDELLKATENPMLLAMLDLEAMRTGSSEASSGLEQQKPYFAAQMPLYEYLLAAQAFYVENKPAEVLRLIPDAARQSSFSYVQFSRQLLRGLALEALKDRNALGFWMQMLPGAKVPFERPALELAIAYHEERAGEIRDVFAPASPVHYPYLREVLLANVADAGLLRTQATNIGAPQQERDIALFTLLYKEATR